MLITEIRPEKGHLVGLYTDGEHIVSLDSDLAAECRLKPMTEYPVGALQEMLTQSQLRRAKSKALYLLEFRDYSRRDMVMRLKKDFDEPSAEAAADYLEDIGALDDARYAENIIRHLISGKHYGRRRILQELAQKGIDRRTAEAALETFDHSETDEIRSLLEGKFARNLDDPKDIRRTVASLLRYGYSQSDIFDALRDYAAHRDDTDESDE